MAEADDAEGHRRQTLPPGRRVDPPRKRPRQVHVRLEALADARGPEVAQHHPQLQRAEATPELDAGVHQVLHRRGLGGLQVLGDQRERLPQQVHAPAVEDRTVKRREEPLVRVDDQRVGPLRAAEGGAPRGQHRHHARVGRIDMEPDALGLAQVRDVVHRIDRRGRGRADGRDHCQRHEARAAIGSDGLAQQIDAHGVLGVAGDVDDRVLSKPQQDHRLVGRRMRVGGQIDAHAGQIGAAEQAPRADVGNDGFAGRGQRVEHRHRRGVVDHAFKRGRQLHQVAQPAQRDLLELGGRR